MRHTNSTKGLLKFSPKLWERVVGGLSKRTIVSLATILIEASTKKQSIFSLQLSSLTYVHLANTSVLGSFSRNALTQQIKHHGTS